MIKFRRVLPLIFQERDLDLSNEQQRQEENDQLRKQFAQAANAFHGWLTETRSVSIGCLIILSLVILEANLSLLFVYKTNCFVINGSQGQYSFQTLIGFTQNIL